MNRTKHITLKWLDNYDALPTKIQKQDAQTDIIDMIAENERLNDAIDFIENNLVGYGAGYGIAHKEMILEDEYANQISAHGKDIFECIVDGKRTMKELAKDYA